MKITIIEANSDLGVKVDGANLGPHILSEHFKDKFDVVKVDKGNFTKNKEENNKCRNLEAVNDFDERLYNTILELKENNIFPLNFGGDHTVAIPSALASIKKEDSLGIIWIDAHSDYNTFETTVTGNLHGLPLAAVNERCNNLTKFHKGNYYKNENTVIVGGRDIDDWEWPNLEKDHIKVFTTEDIHKYGPEEIMRQAFEIASNGTKGVHISYDIDVIDPVVAPGVSVPARDGITKEEALEIADIIPKYKNIIKSMDVVEFNPTTDIDHKTEDLAVEIINRITKIKED
ncbi:MAG: arginase [Bacilli bacterium]|nr:arginase [Bacilli bacterium]